MYSDQFGTYENEPDFDCHYDCDDLETLGQNESFEHSISEREAEGYRDEYNDEHEDFNDDNGEQSPLGGDLCKTLHLIKSTA
jgi:hypothetical protein